MRISLVRIAALLAALTLPSAAQGGRPLVEAHGFAPPGRWTTDGGSPSRSGQSFARALRHAPEEAWSLRFTGDVESEPRVWDGVVTVSVHEAASRRSLRQIELATGRTLLQQVIPSSVPLEPAVWADRIVVRPAKDRLDVYRVRTGRLFNLRTLRAKESISRPLVVDGELYVRVDDVLQRYDLDGRDPVWTARIDGAVRGTPSVRGGGVYALSYDSTGNAHVVLVDRADGSPIASALAGHHNGARPGRDEDATITVLGDAVFVRYPRPVPSTAGSGRGTGRIDRIVSPAPIEGAPPEVGLGSGALHDWVTGPTAWRSGWLTLERRPSNAGTEERWILASDDPEGLLISVLADRANHGELTTTEVPASRTGDVVYLAGVAADLVTREILWKRPAPHLRPVPADGYLLVVEEEGKLTALRPTERTLAPASVEVAAVEARLEAETAERYALLAKESLPIGERAVTERLILEASRLGARGRTLDLARDGLERMTGSGSSGSSGALGARRLEGLAIQERALAGRTAAELFDRARDARAPELVRAYLRAVLTRDPAHADARAAVRRLVPSDAPTPAGTVFDALSWLDFLDVNDRSPVRFVGEGKAGTTRAELELVRDEARDWSRDVVGWSSERMLVVTRPGRPGEVARCLEIGELVCDVLESIFEPMIASGSRGAQASGEPMVILLYESQAEYVAQSKSSGSGPEAGFGWTAGHYSGGDNRSRLFVPSDDVDLERLLGVYAHELTHHWLATRAPFASRKSDPKLPYWLVEGFANLVEEFTLDPRAGEWDPKNPRAGSLDIVANAPEGTLLPWTDVLTMSYEDFAELDPGPVTTVPLAWRIGVRAEQSEIALFYAQAGALCHYLFQTSAEDRQHLIEAVEAWYRRERGSRAFALGGRTAAALGREVEAFATRTVTETPR